MTYDLENDGVFVAEHSFGFIVTLDYDIAGCPSVRPVSSDIVKIGDRTFKVDSATDFGDSYDILCFEVK